MSQRSYGHGSNFQDAETTAKEFLRIIGTALPKIAGKEKVATMIIVLDILSRIPMNEFLNIRNATDDFQRMTPSNQELVLSDLRRKITEFKIGT